MGHRFSDRKQSAKDSAWYAEIERENLERIEREWMERQQQAQKQGQGE